MGCARKTYCQKTDKESASYGLTIGGLKVSSTVSFHPALSRRSRRVKAESWLSISPEVVPAVTTTWESLCENQHAIVRCKPSTGVVWRVAIDSPGYFVQGRKSPPQVGTARRSSH